MRPSRTPKPHINISSGLISICTHMSIITDKSNQHSGRWHARGFRLDVVAGASAMSAWSRRAVVHAWSWRTGSDSDRTAKLSLTLSLRPVALIWATLHQPDDDPFRFPRAVSRVDLPNHVPRLAGGKAGVGMHAGACSGSVQERGRACD
jgi:hypothetical protein